MLKKKPCLTIKGVLKLSLIRTLLKLEQTPSVLTFTSLDVFVGIASFGCLESYGEDFQNTKYVFGFFFHNQNECLVSFKMFFNSALLNSLAGRQITFLSVFWQISVKLQP